MAQVKPKSPVISGVGSAYAQLPSTGEVVELLKCTDISFEISMPTEQVYGGDGTWALDSFEKDKSGTCKLSSAQFNVLMLRALFGSTLAQAGVLVKAEQVTVATAAAQTTATANVVVESVFAVVDESSVGLTRVTGVPTATQFKVTTAGVLTFDASLNGKKVNVYYLVTDTTSNNIAIKFNDTPLYVEIRHTSKPKKLADGTSLTYHTVIYKARAKGSFSFDFKRGSAMVPNLEFEILDPERTDGKVMDVTEVVA